MLSPAERTLRARAAAYALHAQGGTSTKAGTSAFLARFERQVIDQAAARGQTLTLEETARRAALARKSYMTSLALKASRKRSRRSASAGQD